MADTAPRLLPVGTDTTRGLASVVPPILEQPLVLTEGDNAVAWYRPFEFRDRGRAREQVADWLWARR